MTIFRTLLAVITYAVSFCVLAQGAMPQVEVYQNPACPCCKKWVAHLQSNGFKVKVNEVDDIDVARAKLGMPARYGSCHTAVVGGYLVEGHVPAGDIRVLLKERPKAIGLSVPGMVTGSPGMEGPNPQPYETLLIKPDGTASVFARH